MLVYNIKLNATGPWTGCSYSDTTKYATGEKGKVVISDSDKKILRKLDFIGLNSKKDYNLVVMKREKKTTKKWKDNQKSKVIWK